MPNSNRNLVTIGITGLLFAAAGGAVGYKLGQDAGFAAGRTAGYADGFKDGKASVLSDDEERPPIIVSSGGSVTFEVLPHSNGSGRGKIERSLQKFTHINKGVANQKPPKGIDVTVYGSGNGDCKTMAEPFKKVTSLTISYGPDSNPDHWLKASFGDPDSTTPIDLNWTISNSEKLARINTLEYMLELEHDANPPWYLRLVTLTDHTNSSSSVDKSCLFTKQTGDEAVYIEQKKK